MDGAIAALSGIGPDGLRWGPLSKDVVIRDIERGTWEYMVEDEPKLNPIFVVHGRHLYLRTPPNPLKNLGDLPEIEPVVH
jgi:hypothetical protein